MNEGYLRYTQFRALQHFSSATLSVLSTQVFLLYVFISNWFMKIKSYVTLFNGLNLMIKTPHYEKDVSQLLTPFQSLLFAAGLRPTPAQATAVSWVKIIDSKIYRVVTELVVLCANIFCYLMQILKDGMQHVGKLICSNLGARMDSEPKCWRILGP